MNYKIYIEALNGFPKNDWSTSAYLGFKERQADIYFYEDIQEVPTQRNIILVGCIEDTNEFLSRFDLGPKVPLNIPEELDEYRFTGRETGKCIYEVLKRMEDKHYPVFIKPAGKAKEFVPGVVKSRKDLDMFFHNLPEETHVFCSSVVNFVSEYRCYIINGEIKGIKHYFGDFFIFPDAQKIKDMVRTYTNAPAGYSLDVGVLDTGETVLVECNDGWSLGNYGLEPNLYVSLLVARWRELFKRNDQYHFCPPSPRPGDGPVIDSGPSAYSPEIRPI